MGFDKRVQKKKNLKKMNQIQLGPEWAGLGSVGPVRTGLGLVGSVWTGLGLVGPVWTGLGLVGLDMAWQCSSGWTGLVITVYWFGNKGTRADSSVSY